MTKDQSIYEKLVALGGVTYPGFEIRYKDESLLMRVLGAMLFFNKGFLTRYATTVGRKIYFPSRDWVRERGYFALSRTVAHELVHVDDGRVLGVRFAIGYLAPQIFSLLALLCVFSPWWLLLLVLLAPIPSPWRKRFEMRGYQMALAVDHWRTGNTNREHVVGKFTGPDYYFMWPFEKLVRNEVDRLLEGVKSGVVLEEEPIFRLVHGVLREHGALHAE